MICSHLSANHMLIAIALCTKNCNTRHNYSHKLCGLFPDEYLLPLLLHFRTRASIFTMYMTLCIGLLNAPFFVAISSFTQQYLHLCIINNAQHMYNSHSKISRKRFCQMPTNKIGSSKYTFWNGEKWEMERKYRKID